MELDYGGYRAAVGAGISYAASDGDWRVALAGGLAGGALGGAMFNKDPTYGLGGSESGSLGGIAGYSTVLNSFGQEFLTASLNGAVRFAQNGGTDPDLSSDARSWQYIPVGSDGQYQATGVSGIYYDYITTYTDAKGKIRLEYVKYTFNTLYFEFPRVRADGSVISAMDAARLSAAAKDMAEEQVEILLGGKPRPMTSTLENTFLTTLRSMLAPFGARVSLTPNYGTVPVTPYSKTFWGNGR